MDKLVFFKDKKLEKCMIVENSAPYVFQGAINELISLGYKIECSSCNSSVYKAVLVLNDDCKMWHLCADKVFPEEDEIVLAEIEDTITHVKRYSLCTFSFGRWHNEESVINEYYLNSCNDILRWMYIPG